MVAQNILIGPIAAMYVGHYGSSDPLTRVTSVSTAPIVVTETLPEVFLPGLQTTIQNGMHEVRFSTSFYGDDELLLALSRGLSSFDSGDIDTASEFNTYQVLLLHPDEDVNSSWYFPQVRVIHDTTLNYSKTQPTEITLQFTWQDRNRYNPIYYQGTYDYLIDIMGPVSPI